MTDAPSRPYCGLCDEPKFAVQTVWFCHHCDTTIGCDPECGACKMARDKRYSYDD